MSGLEIVFIALLVVSIPIGGFFYMLHLDQMEWDKAKAADKAWLEEELSNPRYFVSFDLLDGSVKRTADMKPQNTLPGSDWNKRMTSAEVALQVMCNMHKRGYFTDLKGVTYPSCNVAKAAVTRESP